MIDAEFAPLLQLRGDIKTFSVFEVPEIPIQRGLLLPDPYVLLVFNCGSPILSIAEDGREFELPRAFVGGLQAKPFHIQAEGTLRNIAVCLYPWALQTLIGVPTRIANTSLITLDGIWNDLAQTLATIVRQRGFAEAVDCLQQFVSSVYRPDAALAPIRAAGERLFASQGRLRIGELAAQSYLSPSQFERSFKHLTGISPKAFARLIRFDSMRECLTSNPSIRPLDLALDYGYSDQAHLIREFRSFADCTPGEYAQGLRANSPA
ncbi:MAG: helix-turn-helix domain-containing protein [Chloroflexota bacterium]